ncbi:hypothetical protein MASR1M45_04550 [Candidatus Kapaibacterium sp.]
MKLVLSIFIYQLFACILLYSNQFEITPLQINFIGIEAKGDTVITYGDYGSMLISYDNAETWEQIKVFENHLILKIYWNNDKIVAVNNKGQVAESYDKFKKWNLIYDINEQIEAISESKDGYFVRTPDKVLLLDSNFNKISESKLISPPLPLTFKFQYRRSIAYFKDYYYVAIDSARFIKHDKQLAVTDTIDMPQVFGTTINSMYEIDIVESNFVFRIGNTIYKTQDFGNIDVVYNIKYVGFLKSIQGKFYYLTFSNLHIDGAYNSGLNIYEIINKDSLIIISGADNLNAAIYTIDPNSFIIHKNKIMIVGSNKLIVSIKLESNDIDFKSYLSASSSPDQFTDSKLLFYSEGFYGEYLGQIYKTDNMGITFQPFYKYDYSKYNEYNRIIYKYIETNGDKLYLFAKNNENDAKKAIISINSVGDNKIEKDGFGVVNRLYYRLPNMQITNQNLIFANNFYYNNNNVTYISFFTKEFDYLSSFNILNLIVYYFHSSDTNTFMISCFNTIDKNYEIKFTSDKGKNWDIIKKYDSTVSLLHYKELYSINSKQVAFFMTNSKDSTLMIDLMNIDDGSIRRIYHSKLLLASGKTYPSNFNAITYDNEKYYIAIEDTLFQTTDLFDKSKWEYYLLPNNGLIMKNLKKINDRFVALYKDDNRNMNLFWLKPIGNPTSVTESHTETQNYLYTYPPYPLPATNEVHSLIYWDTSTDIENGDMAVYSIYGTKVAGKEKLRIDKLTSYSGILVWDCSDVQSGIYLITIKHGTESRAVKVIVNK